MLNRFSFHTKTIIIYVSLLFVLITGTENKVAAQSTITPVYLDYGTADGDDQAYLWKFNSLYTASDTSMNYIAVAFNNGDGYTDPADPAGSIIGSNPFPTSFFIDTLFINMTHENNSGLYDHFIVQIVNLVGDSIPGTTVLWESDDSTNVSLSSSGNWIGTGALFPMVIPVGITLNQRFGVVIQYIDPTFMDTCGIVGTFIDDGSGNCQIQSVYPNSWMRFPPMINTIEKNSNVGYGAPVGSQGWFQAQNWGIYARIDSGSNFYGTNFYFYINEVTPNCSNNGALTITNYGGVAPFTYLWSNGGTDSTITGLGAGTYSVTVTDSTGTASSGSYVLNSSCINILNGNVFNDLNSNCISDNGELPIPNIYITVTNGSNQSYYGLTDSIGNYSVNVPIAGNFNIYAYNYAWGYGSCNSIIACGLGTVTFPALGDTSNNNNFVISGNSDHDLGIYVTYSGANPGFEMYYNLYPYDFSVPQFQGLETVSFSYDYHLDFDSSNNAQVADDSLNHTLTWVGANVPNWFFGATPLTCYFHVPVTLSPNYLVQSDFFIDPVANDCYTGNNHLHISDFVTGSFDPNEKTVSPAGNITHADSVLTYNIHFQNTGNDTTHFVIVIDTLPSALDPTTVINLASSAPFSEFTVSDGGILKWVFNPLLLPDSATNEPGSKGFIMFKVKVKPNLPFGTQINNTASIYFDYNAPVLTNTASNSIISGIAEVSDGSGQLTVFPNPAVEELTVSSNKQIMNEIVVSDVLGRVVYSHQANSQFSIINCQLLANGVYFIKVQLQNGEVVVERFVKE